MSYRYFILLSGLLLIVGLFLLIGFFGALIRDWVGWSLFNLITAFSPVFILGGILILDHVAKQMLRLFSRRE